MDYESFMSMMQQGIKDTSQGLMMYVMLTDTRMLFICSIF